jgi:hypothetical protein
MRIHPSRPSPALVISIVALLMAMGGTGYAAFKLPRNSVGTAQIKKNAVTSAKVKNGSLKPPDFARGAFPAGGQGPKGDTGPAGANGANGTNGLNGSAKAYARVSASQDITFSKNVTAVTRPSASPIGNYCVAVAGANPATDVAIVTPDYTNDTTSAAGGTLADAEWGGNGVGGCPAGTFLVRTFQVDGMVTATDSNGDTYEHFQVQVLNQGFIIAIP